MLNDNGSLQMGANLRQYGATFRIWAPAAKSVNVQGTFSNWTNIPLGRQEEGYWYASVDGVKEGDEYLFLIDGPSGIGFKRDPYARALTKAADPKDSNCIVTRPHSFPWHDQKFRPPHFSDLVIYQLHIGAYWSVDEQGRDRRAYRPGRFLDLLERVDHFLELGVNAIQFLPIQEFAGPKSLGYNGLDLFSPEMDYSVAPNDPDFNRYLDCANALLARFNLPPYGPTELECQTKQFMAVIDIFHLHGIAIILDVVYNHAGGGFDEKSLYFLDRDMPGDNNRSLYFTSDGWAGGLVFAYWKREVRQFLIDNAGFFLDEYHIDGFRFDEVTVIDRHGGWSFLQDCTDTLRAKKPYAPLISEYWADQSAVLRSRNEGGAGFDATLSSGLREAIRDVLIQMSHGAEGSLSLDSLASELQVKSKLGWRQVQHLENHDVVRVNNDSDRKPRIPKQADPSNSESWYARSRGRLATGLLLTTPGIPMIFMGEEIFEDRYWSDNIDYFRESVVQWDLLKTSKSRQDFFRFIRELLRVRVELQSLRQGSINVFHMNNETRVMGFHRWVEGLGNDVVVVCNFSEKPLFAYRLGFPASGSWRERFNSDVYDQWVNPHVVGNGTGIFASQPPLHTLPASAEIVLPANGFLIFTQ